jgi:hypothetical protein
MSGMDASPLDGWDSCGKEDTRVRQNATADDVEIVALGYKKGDGFSP